MRDPVFSLTERRAVGCPSTQRAFGQRFTITVGALHTWEKEKLWGISWFRSTSSRLVASCTFLLAWIDPGGMQLLLMFCSCSSCVTVSIAASRSRCMHSSWRLWCSCVSTIHFRISCTIFVSCVQKVFILSKGKLASASTVRIKKKWYVLWLIRVKSEIIWCLCCLLQAECCGMEWAEWLN